MCEPASVIKTLERIRQRLELSDNDAETLEDITMCIAQLQVTNSGTAWCNPDVALAKYYAARAGGTFRGKEGSHRGD